MTRTLDPLARLSADERRALLERLLRERAGAPAEYPLSHEQERMWVLDRIRPGTAVYTIPAVLRLSGPLDVAVLERALDAVVRRHESLRTVFRDAAGGTVQVALPEVRVPLELHDLRSLPEAARQARVRDEVRRPWDLRAGPLLRAVLLRTGAEEHALVLAMHHAVSDGWSVGVLLRELSALYGALSGGAPPPLAPLPLQYGDYARWQREQPQDEALAYWTGALAGAPAVLDLPGDRPRPPVAGHAGATHRFALGAALSEAVRRTARREGATPFMVLLAAFAVLLARYAGRDDLVVGTPIANRARPGVEGLIGFFANTLALRIELRGAPTVAELVRRVRRRTLEAYAHPELPFARLVEALGVERQPGRNPLVQVIFGLDAPLPPVRLGQARARLELGDTGTARVDLTLLFSEDAAGYTGVLEYATELWDAPTVRRMAGHLRTLLEAMTRPGSAGVPVDALPLMDDAERREVLAAGHGRAAAYAVEPVHRMVEAQVRRTPDAVALVHGTERVTFAELNARANRLAHRLRALGVGAETRVAVCLERTPDLVAALLAVLKAGAAYVPLDPAYPAQRLQYVLEDADAALLLTQGSLRGLLPPRVPPLLLVDGVEPSGEREDDPDAWVDPSCLAYLIYTSGSTGRPKAVAIPHAAACTMLRWAAETWSREECAGVLACTSVCFDISVFELFLPLTTGTRAILARDPLALAGLPAVGEVTLLNTVPSAAAQLLRTGAVPPSVVTVNLAGEPLPRALAQACHALPHVRRVCNLYGPSEDTTYSTVADVPAGEAGPPAIGAPAANTRAHVLDPRGRPVPRGVAGELFLAGDGVARGYLGRPAATAERFVPDPFSPLPGGRMYRTGDRVRRLPDGSMHCLGRLDHQVKVRGFRVEPGEIEAALGEHPGVRECVVVAHGEGSERGLAAYVVGRGGPAPRADALREHLRARLPEHMVPAFFVPLDALPLTPNGKTDRAALPAPGAGAGAGAFVPPEEGTQARVAALWAEVLGAGRVGAHDNFFEIGGNSLLLAQVQAALPERLGRGLPMLELFRHPTVAALARRLDEGGEGGGPDAREAEGRAATRQALRQRQRAVRQGARGG